MFNKYLNLPREIHVLCLGTFVNRAGTFILPFLTFYLRDRLGLSVEFATMTMSLYGLGAIVGAVIGGHLADLIGRRIVMLTALFGGAAMLIVYSTVSTPTGIVVATFTFAVIGDMYRPAASAMIADLVEPDRRPHAYGLMYIAINLGFAVGPVIGGFIMQWSIKWLFYGDALTSCAYAVVIIFAIRETAPNRKGRGAAHAAEPALDASLGAAIRHLFHDTVYQRFCLGLFLTALIFMQSMSTFPLYMQQFGFGASTYGWVIAVNGILIVLLQIPLTSFVVRHDRSTMLVIGSLLTGIGFGLNAMTSQVWHFAATVVLWTLGEMFQAALVAPIVSDLAPPRFRARYMGVLTIAHSSANFLGALLGGMVLARFGGQFLWPATAILALFSAFMFLTVRRGITKR